MVFVDHPEPRWALGNCPCGPLVSYVPEILHFISNIFCYSTKISKMLNTPLGPVLSLAWIEILLLILFVYLSGQAPSDHALTDQEYKRNMGAGYVFFEILRPEDLSYTYKLNPAAFSVPWNMTTSTATLVLADPPCGCGALKNYEDIEGNIALIERGDCSFTSKGVSHAYN